MYRDSKGRFAKKATPKYYNNRDAKGRFTRHMLKEMVKSCKECWEPEEPVIKEDGLTAEDYIAKGIDMIMDEMGYAVNDAKAHNVTITITVDGKDLDLI